MTRVDFPFCPRLYILGDPKQVAHCEYADFVLTAIMIGRQVLMRGWKKCFVFVGFMVAVYFVPCYCEKYIKN